METSLLKLAMTDRETGLPNEVAMRTFAQQLKAIAARHGGGLKLLRMQFSNEKEMVAALPVLRPHVRCSDVLSRTAESELTLLLMEENEGGAEIARGRLATVVSGADPAVLRIEPVA